MDRALVELARHGDHDAFTAVMLSLGDRLFQVAKLILRDADLAEDVVQDAMIRAWRDLPRLRDADRFEAWMRRMVVNRCYDAARRRRRQVDIRLVPDPGTADRSGDLIIREQFDAAFRRLPVEQRAILVLHHHVGLTLAEVAETVGVPIGTAKSRLHYAARAMRAAIDAEDRVLMTEEPSRWA